jgi:hypothetical protein
MAKAPSSRKQSFNGHQPENWSYHAKGWQQIASFLGQPVNVAQRWLPFAPEQLLSY